MQLEKCSRWNLIPLRELAFGKYKYGKMNFVSAVFIGLQSNWKAKRNLNIHRTYWKTSKIDFKAVLGSFSVSEVNCVSVFRNCPDANKIVFYKVKLCFDIFSIVKSNSKINGKCQSLWGYYLIFYIFCLKHFKLQINQNEKSIINYRNFYFSL
jgi:hypothetical protein